MRKLLVRMSAVLLVLGALTGTIVLAADSADGKQYVGVWNGTWEGAGGSGRFDLTLTQGSDGKIAGGVSVGSEGGDYVAKFKSLSFDGSKLAAKYDYPPDEQGEITLTATLEGSTVKGTWALGAKGQGGDAMANGTWTVTKK